MKYIVSPGWKPKGEDWQREYVIAICDDLALALGKAMLYLNDMIDGIIDGDKYLGISTPYIMEDSDDGWILWIEEKKHETEEGCAEDIELTCTNHVRIFRFEESENEFDYDSALRNRKRCLR